MKHCSSFNVLVPQRNGHLYYYFLWNFDERILEVF